MIYDNISHNANVSGADWIQRQLQFAVPFMRHCNAMEILLQSRFFFSKKRVIITDNK